MNHWNKYLQQAQLQAKALLEIRRRKGADRFTKYKDDPVGFIENELGYSLTQQQIEIVQSVWNKSETNVQAAHGQGKTFIAALIVLAWLYVRKGRVITTAPTARQVRFLLWAEIRKAWPRGRFPGRAPDTVQLIVNDDIFAVGFTAEDTDENSFQGMHHERLLGIEDEASGISKPVDDGMTSCVSGRGNALLRIGNPVDPSSAFRDSCESEGAIKIPAFDHPNVSWAYDGDTLTDEVREAIVSNGEIIDREHWPDWCQKEDPIPGAISIEWIEKQRRKHGEDSNFWKSRVRAEWSEDAADSILPFSWFEAAIERYENNPEHWHNLANEYMTRHGLDVADGGDDHATATWHGPLALGCKAYTTKGDMFDISRAAQIGVKLAMDGGHIVIDNTGVGAGALSEIAGRQDIRSSGMRFGGEAGNKEEFANLKAEGFWSLREAFRTQTVAVVPFEGWRELARELSMIGYIDTGTKIRIEEKSKTKKKLGHSPDRADAFMMAYFAPSIRKKPSKDITIVGSYANADIM